MSGRKCRQEEQSSVLYSQIVCFMLHNSKGNLTLKDLNELLQFVFKPLFSIKHGN